MNTLIKNMPRVGTYWEGEGGHNGGIFTPRDGSEPRILIVDIAHMLQRKRWGKVESVVDATSLFDGAANTLAILRSDPDNEIAKHFTALDTDGHKDFFLPSVFELTHLFVTMGDKILEALDGWGAWSSTQLPDFPSYACVQFFDYGYQYWSHKFNEFGAVAVRSKSLSY
ncbi:hypothetical protein [Caballeronia sp. dw_19]|uniref:hypothetical protein n=1 Tax=Caballeronia sp. dw_19 TaxID=2719791 RepID=UPI001BCF3603|nr:hypothetical protein [Caballeronia sp. dw_19]